MFKRCCALVLTLSLPWGVAAAAPANRIGESDYQSLVGLDSPAISPDGKHAIVKITRILWNDDKRSSDLVTVDLATGAQQTLLSHRDGLSDAAFSPDGTQIAFLAEDGAPKDSNTQL
ncbi:MAG: hypothetical protein WAK19_01575, partial [Candidatus Cybelea sp.]